MILVKFSRLDVSIQSLIPLTPTAQGYVTTGKRHIRPRWRLTEEPDSDNSMSPCSAHVPKDSLPHYNRNSFHNFNHTSKSCVTFNVHIMSLCSYESNNCTSHRKYSTVLDVIFETFMNFNIFLQVSFRKQVKTPVKICPTRTYKEGENSDPVGT